MSGTLCEHGRNTATVSHWLWNTDKETETATGGKNWNDVNKKYKTNNNRESGDSKDNRRVDRDCTGRCCSQLWRNKCCDILHHESCVSFAWYQLRDTPTHTCHKVPVCVHIFAHACRTGVKHTLWLTHAVVAYGNGAGDRRSNE